MPRRSRLYDTYGFPLDPDPGDGPPSAALTVDQAGFDAAMADQRERARRAGKFTAAGVEALRLGAGAWALKGQRFVGYEQLEVVTNVHKWAVKDGRLHVVLAETPFYAEGGRARWGDRGRHRGGCADPGPWRIRSATVI